MSWVLFRRAYPDFFDGTTCWILAWIAGILLIVGEGAQFCFLGRSWYVLEQKLNDMYESDFKWQMSTALVATGYWMYIDVPHTPNAVVVCVIIFNAAFGYRSVWANNFLDLCSSGFSLLVGAQFRGCIHPRSVILSGAHLVPFLMMDLDHATFGSREGCISVYRHQLVLQFYCRGDDTISSRSSGMAIVSNARILLRL